MKLQPIPIISYSAYDKDRFVVDFINANVPCLIEGLVTKWPAYKKWDKKYFKETLGNLDIAFHDFSQKKKGIINHIAEGKLSDFIARLEKGDNIRHFGLSHPFYDFVRTTDELNNALNITDIEKLVPKNRFLGLSAMNYAAWPWCPPYSPQMYIAGANISTLLHYDQDHSHNFHWCVWGCKKVTLFAYDEQYNNALRNLQNIDFSQPLDEKIYKKLPILHNLQGWNATLQPHQILFLPSKMWHHFKNEEVSLSYAVRARSFNTLEKYCEFLQDDQTPTVMIPYLASLWRRVDWRQRSLIGHILVWFKKPVIIITRLLAKLLFAVNTIKSRFISR